MKVALKPMVQGVSSTEGALELIEYISACSSLQLRGLVADYGLPKVSCYLYRNDYLSDRVAAQSRLHSPSLLDVSSVGKSDQWVSPQEAGAYASTQLCEGRTLPVSMRH